MVDSARRRFETITTHKLSSFAGVEERSNKADDNSQTNKIKETLNVYVQY